MTRIAFLGLGAMGSRVATNIAEAGHSIVGWSRSGTGPDSVPRAGTIRDTVGGADVVIAMVTDDAASAEVWDAALPHMKPKALAVEASTVSPGRVQALSKATAAAGVALIDAPVAGSRPQAEARELVFLVGGRAADIDRFRALAATTSKALLHAGATGQGGVLKLMINGLLAAQTAAMAELLAYGSRMGLDMSSALDLITPIPVTSPAAAFVGRQIADGTHAPMFTIDLLVKDLGYLISGSDAPFMAAVRNSFERAQSRGLGGQHISAVATA